MGRRFIVCDGAENARLWSRIGADEREILVGLLQRDILDALLFFLVDKKIVAAKFFCWVTEPSLIDQEAAARR